MAISTVLDSSTCIAVRPGGVFADPDAQGATLLGAVDALYRAGNLLVGVDYPVLMRALYGIGPALPKNSAGAQQVRIAADLRPFDPTRRALYRAVKIQDGQADYVFEPLWLPDPADPDGPGLPAELDVDEFIADMWSKGIRCGVDLAAVRAAIDGGRAERITVAARIRPVPGRDASIVEVSDDLHRSNAPRQLANGRLDLTSFQNRFPQVQAGVRLLRKVPATRGQGGWEMSGIPILAEDGKDLDLASYAGTGTTVQRAREGEFLVASQHGFLQVDSGSSRISVGDKIVSHDGVSARTTGNLDLSGDYEEFGEVQEKRVVEGESITVHGDVFGSVVSRGGEVLLHANLMGGSARNRRGGIKVLGVASNAVIQAGDGLVELARAENCVVAGTRVRIEHAVNCDVIGDEVEIAVAEGSAVAGRRVQVGQALPRKGVEALLYVLRPEGPKVAEVIAAVTGRLARFAELVAGHQAEIARIGNHPELRRYMMLRTKVKNNEVQLSPEQTRQFQNMAQAVAPMLKGLAEVSAQLKAAQAEQQAGSALLAKLEEQRRDTEGSAAVAVGAVQGELQIRVLGFSPAAGVPYRQTPREIKLRLRGPQSGEVLFAGAEGAFQWCGEDDAP